VREVAPKAAARVLALESLSEQSGYSRSVGATKHIGSETRLLLTNELGELLDTQSGQVTALETSLSSVDGSALFGVTQRLGRVLGEQHVAKQVETEIQVLVVLPKVLHFLVGEVESVPDDADSGRGEAGGHKLHGTLLHLGRNLLGLGIVL